MAEDSNGEAEQKSYSMLDTILWIAFRTLEPIKNFANDQYIYFDQWRVISVPHKELPFDRLQAMQFDAAIEEFFNAMESGKFSTYSLLDKSNPRSSSKALSGDFWSSCAINLEENSARFVGETISNIYVPEDQIKLHWPDITDNTGIILRFIPNHYIEGWKDSYGFADETLQILDVQFKELKGLIDLAKREEKNKIQRRMIATKQKQLSKALKKLSNLISDPDLDYQRDLGQIIGWTMQARLSQKHILELVERSDLVSICNISNGNTAQQSHGNSDEFAQQLRRDSVVSQACRNRNIILLDFVDSLSEKLSHHLDHKKQDKGGRRNKSISRDILFNFVLDIGRAYSLLDIVATPESKFVQFCEEVFDLFGVDTMGLDVYISRQLLKKQNVTNPE